MTPVQTSPRVCVRTSHSPVSLARSPSLLLSLALPLSAHTHAEVPERRRPLTGAFLGIVGGPVPAAAVRGAPLPCTAPLPEPESSPPGCRGAAAAAPPRPGAQQCEEGPQVGARRAEGLRRTHGAGRAPARPPRPPLRGDSQVCAPLSGSCPATPSSLIPELLLLRRERAARGCARAWPRPPWRSGVRDTAGKC